MDENVGRSTPGEWVGIGERLLFRRLRFSRSLAAADLIRSFVCCEAISHRKGSFGASRGAFRCTFGSVSPSTLLLRPRVSVEATLCGFCSFAFFAAEFVAVQSIHIAANPPFLNALKYAEVSGKSWRHLLQHLVGWESMYGRTTIVDPCKEGSELEAAISKADHETRVTKPEPGMLGTYCVISTGLVDVIEGVPRQGQRLKTRLKHDIT